MRRLELGLLFLALDGHFASEGLLGVLDVLGERGDRLVVASLGGVGGLERLVVLDERRSLGLRCAVRDLWVLFKDLLVRIEGVRMFGPLAEWLILHHRLRVFAFSLSKILGSIVVVFHVDRRASKIHLFAVLASLNRVSSNVRWLNDDVCRVLLRAIVLLDLHEV